MSVIFAWSKVKGVTQSRRDITNPKIYKISYIGWNTTYTRDFFSYRLAAGHAYMIEGVLDRARFRRSAESRDHLDDSWNLHPPIRPARQNLQILSFFKSQTKMTHLLNFLPTFKKRLFCSTHPLWGLNLTPSTLYISLSIFFCEGNKKIYRGIVFP
jgi:hypothetical protein